MKFEPFEYMHWAKNQVSGPGHRLTRSGVLPPPADLLNLDSSLLALEEVEPAGPVAVKSLIASRYEITPDRVFMIGGAASMALFLVGICCLEKDDLVLAESPGYESFFRFAQFAGARVEPLPRDYATGWSLNRKALENGLARGAKMVVISNLHNPTGAAIPPAELAEIAQMVGAAGARLVADEVFSEFFPIADRPPAAHTLHPQAITLASFTKAFGLGSLRSGWILANPELIERCKQGYDLMQVLCPTVPINILEKFLLAEDRTREWLARELSGMPAALEKLAAHPALSFHPPAGGVSIFPAIDGLADTENFCNWLGKNHRVFVTPGRFFNCPERIRIGLALPPAAMAAAIDAFLVGLDEFRAIHAP